MNKRVLNLTFMLLSLICGGAIYLLFRPETYVTAFFDVFLKLENLRSAISFLSCGFINCYFVDFLWGYSLCCGFIAVFLPKKRNLLYCVLIPLGMGVLWEVLQYFGVVKGTGDIIDVLMYLLAAFSAIIVNLKEKEK